MATIRHLVVISLVGAFVIGQLSSVQGVSTQTVSEGTVEQYVEVLKLCQEATAQRKMSPNVAADREALTQYAQIFGDGRYVRAVAWLSSHLAVESPIMFEPRGLVGVTEQYPAVGACISIGLPSVVPVLQSLIQRPEERFQAGYVIRNVLPKGVAMAWLLEFRNELKADERKTLDALIDDLRSFDESKFAALPAASRIEISDSAPKTVPTATAVLSDNPAVKKAALEQMREIRRYLIGERMRSAKRLEKWDINERETRTIVDELSSMRAGESAVLLAPHVALKRSGPIAATQGESTVVDEYPVASALAEIGLPAVRPLLSVVMEGEQEEPTRQAAVLVFRKMMPRTAAIALVDAETKRTPDGPARERLRKLCDSLEKEQSQ